jgi:nuclear transport factor 2 (NTF2) superfamily protein
MPVLTPQVREIVDWWKEYGIRNWETDDVHPMFRELMSKISELPTDEEEQYLFDIYRR